MRNIFVSIMCVLLFGLPCAADVQSPTTKAAQSWNYKNTWVFAVGVLEWQTKDLSSFTTKDRRDAAIVNNFRQRGVPADHVVYLSDKGATLDAITTKFNDTLKKIGPDDTLFFYYCGHGWISEEDGKTGVYANYDAGETDDTAWTTTSIADDLVENFKGSTVICAVDCCFSGSLANALRAAKPDFNYAVLTSAAADESSTSNWTFSQSIFDCLTGHRFADANNDGCVTYSELANYVRDEMRKFEKQTATTVSSANFDKSLCLGKVQFPNEPVPERVEVLWKKEWWPARLIQRKDDQALVRWVTIGYDDSSEDEWVALKDVRSLDK